MSNDKQITGKQYARIDDRVYETDITKKDDPALYRKGDTFYENENNTGQQYQVIKTIDANDPNNSKGYASNGFQAMAIAPVANGKADTSQIIIAYAGTNAKDGKDISTDVENVFAGKQDFTVRTGLNSSQKMASQFTSASQFYDDVAKQYGANNIQSITGHSLGGALAQKVAASNQKPAVTFSTAGPGMQLTQAEKDWLNGAGKSQVLNYVHAGDQITNMTASNYGTKIVAIDYGNGFPFSGHYLPSYHFDKNGDCIVKKSSRDNDTHSGRLTISRGGGYSGGQFIALDSDQVNALASTISSKSSDYANQLIAINNSIDQEIADTLAEVRSWAMGKLKQYNYLTADDVDEILANFTITYDAGAVASSNQKIKTLAQNLAQVSAGLQTAAKTMSSTDDSQAQGFKALSSPTSNLKYGFKK
ncbi:MAG: hypothetical protein LBI13_01595 [Streptococcaceae bacterium]|jgi:uncharacterized protein YukE|nr:hypothetical protein [Streptococcaceae bacterium]